MRKYIKYKYCLSPICSNSKRKTPQ